MFWASFFVPHVITMLKKEIDYVDEPQDSFRISNMLKLLKILQARLTVGAYHANSEYTYLALICKIKI